MKARGQRTGDSGQGTGALARRQFLARALALPAAAALSGCQLTLEDGLFNECRSADRNVLAEPLVAAAWQGLRPDRVWDSHAHLFGNGQSGQGIWLHEEYEQTFTMANARRRFFEDAACGGPDQKRLDQAIVERLRRLADDFPPGAKLVLLAFDHAHDEKGAVRKDLTAFHIPNEYAARVARENPTRFEWMASVHPYREDAVATLESAKRSGVRGVKWLPPAMGIDPASPRCNVFYEAMRRLDIPLLIHVGAEQAVKGAALAPFANPLLLRQPLDRGVRVIAAHCATMGESPDLDASSDPAKAPQARNIDLFARLMGEKRYEGLLFGDLSAVTQANRMEHLPLLLERQEWHSRLLNGSDYPLPGVIPLFSLSAYVRAGLLPEDAVAPLRKLRHENAILFDFVLKRTISSRGSRFAATAFETRDFFLRAS